MRLLAWYITLMMTFSCGASTNDAAHGFPYAMTQKIYFHRGNVRDILVLYTDKKVDVVATGSSFVVPHVGMAPSIKNLFCALARKINRHCAITYTADQIRVVPVTGQPHVIYFDTITQEFGIAFVFYHKSGLVAHAKKERKRKKIVIDCGHGGTDTGTNGHGACEKELTLQIGKKVANRLTQQQYQVSMVRTDDTFIALDERTNFINNADADLCISIHINHASGRQARGIETYYSPFSLCRIPYALTDSDLNYAAQCSWSWLAQNSARLANCVHEQVLKVIQKKFGTDNRKVKQSISQVLFGCEIPAILIELGFLSNKQEARLLQNVDYQDALAQGITEGVTSFVTAGKLASNSRAAG